MARDRYAGVPGFADSDEHSFPATVPMIAAPVWHSCRILLQQVLKRHPAVSDRTTKSLTHFPAFLFEGRLPAARGIGFLTPLKCCRDRPQPGHIGAA